MACYSFHLLSKKESVTARRHFTGTHMRALVQNTSHHIEACFFRRAQPFSHFTCALLHQQLQQHEDCLSCLHHRSILSENLKPGKGLPETGTQEETAGIQDILVSYPGTHEAPVCVCAHGSHLQVRPYGPEATSSLLDQLYAGNLQDVRRLHMQGPKPGRYFTFLL